MSKIKEFIKCYLILSKRLLLKKSFVAILLLVPILVGAVEIAVDKGDSGIVTVALAMEDNDDSIAREIVDSLMEDDNLIRFILCETPSEANAKVETGKADVAWIFQDNLGERIEKFANNSHANNSFVNIVQRESNIFLNMSCEKLNSAIYPYLSKALFLNSSRDNLDKITDEELDKITDEELKKIYDSINAEGDDLFEFVYASQNEPDKLREGGDTSFLVSPLRGFLAIMVVLGGVAVAMFYMNDEEHGVFDRFPRSAGFSFSVAYHTSAVVMVALVVFAAIFIMKISRGVGYELLALSIYSIAVVGFCMCLRLLLRNIRLFGAIAPILIIVMVVVCPILYPAPNLFEIQVLIPPYYYLCSLTNVNYLWYMLAYASLMLAFAFLLHRFCIKKCRR